VNEEVAEAAREKKITVQKSQKIQQRRGRSIGRVDKVKRGLFPRQRKRNRMNEQVI